MAVRFVTLGWLQIFPVRTLWLCGTNAIRGAVINYSTRDPIGHLDLGIQISDDIVAVND